MRGAAALAVDERLPTPLYHQIYLILRNQIIDGRHNDGDLIAGEEDLARQFNVSRITARRALAELAAEGLVVRARGRGTRVIAPPSAPPIRANVEGLIENLMAMGLKTQVKLMEFDYETASPDVARALKLEPGAEVQRAVRLRFLTDGPFSYLTTYVPASIGRQFGRKELEREPLLGLLERCGVKIGGAEQTISATLADTRVAPLLQTAIGAPLLRIMRVVHDREGVPVEYITGLYRPDRYQYRMALARVETGDRNTWSANLDPAEVSVSSSSSNREKRK
jgi:GntR family transcriptional regulator